MTIQAIIDTFNYSTVTGCKLTHKASENLFAAIIDHLDIEGEPCGHPMGPCYINQGCDIPEGFTTFTGYRPRTKILYGNYCELELLRILFLLRPNELIFRPLYEATKARMSQTCFGGFCAKGECLEISIIALRFIATIYPEEKAWVDLYVTDIAKTLLSQQRKISRRSILMFCQVLSELRREEDGEIIDALLDIVDDRHLPNISKITSAMNDCIFYSALRRTALAS